MKCPHCLGSGKDHPIAHLCPACRGYGQILCSTYWCYQYDAPTVATHMHFESDWETRSTPVTNMHPSTLFRSTCRSQTPLRCATPKLNRDPYLVRTWCKSLADRSRCLLFLLRAPLTSQQPRRPAGSSAFLGRSHWPRRGQWLGLDPSAALCALHTIREQRLLIPRRQHFISDTTFVPG